MANNLPVSVRYVKSGAGGRWWNAAKSAQQVHLGWENIPDDLIAAGDLAAIRPLIQAEFAKPASATQDFNALSTLLDRPSQHLWVTFEEGCMWWCTVRDGVTINPAGQSFELGHFWLTCASPWTNHSIDDKRQLVTTELPGVVTSTSGYRATVCEPSGWREILRIIRNEADEDAHAASLAREAYEAAVSRLVARLSPKDFEVLIDLILSRTGWARLAKLGGATEGIDVEVENAAADEIAFVQVKSSADQATLDDYVARFSVRRDRYQRMIFAVHTPKGELSPPPDLPVAVWAGGHIARLVVKLGLGDWVAARL